MSVGSPQYGDLWLHDSRSEAFLVCETRAEYVYGQHLVLDPDQPTTSNGGGLYIKELQAEYFLGYRHNGTVTT